MASNVSKLLPTVLIVTVPAVGAVQVHQTDFAAAEFAWLGSPVSAVALLFPALTVTALPMSELRLLKLSLAGPKLLSPKTVRISLAYPVPEAFLALRVMVYCRAKPSVPLIEPLLASKINPLG